MNVIHSKLRGSVLEDVFPAFVLLLTSVVLMLLVAPFDLLFERAGLLVFTLVLLGIAMFCLDRSQAERYEDREMTRAWFGAVGGVFAWKMVEMSGYLGGGELVSLMGILLFIMAWLILTTLLRHSLPVGPQLFLLVLMLSWAAHLFVAGQQQMEQWMPFMHQSLRISGFVALAGAVGAFASLLFRQHPPLSRFRMGVWMWFFLLIALYIFIGMAR